MAHLRAPVGEIKESRSDKHVPRFSDSITNQDLGNLTFNTCAPQTWYHTWFIAWAFDRPHDREHAMDTDGLNNALTCVVSRWRLPANMIATRRWVSTGTGVEATCFFPRTNYRPNPLKQPGFNLTWQGHCLMAAKVMLAEALSETSAKVDE